MTYLAVGLSCMPRSIILSSAGIRITPFFFTSAEAKVDVDAMGLSSMTDAGMTSSVGSSDPGARFSVSERIASVGVAVAVGAWGAGAGASVDRSIMSVGVAVVVSVILMTGLFI